ncbi:MAG TPA: sigma 54-interacting transcriptional regulator [Candidatus Acidoferrales bacterium]|nr:sigma 54-interacting transcriptional regulator [Candidatus Acidoferrales bacterium]
MLTPADLQSRFPEGGVIVASPNESFRQKILERIDPSLGTVTEALGGADALAKLDSSPCRLLLLDRRLADLQTEELLSLVRSRFPELRIVLLDSEKEPPALVSDADDAAEALLHQDARPGEESSPLEEPSAAPEVDDQSVEPLPEMIGSTPAMIQVFRLARLVAPRDTTVLLAGETGTGKELVAQAIFQLSRRAKAPFVVVNCAAIPDSLIEAELFGHVRGAFTGAVQSSLGRIHSAHGGTLFLDEAGELPLNLQAKLLRFLQHGEVQRLGSPDVFRVDVRVIAATNADLIERVGRGEFRADLYYRLAVFPIDIPPLRERQDDIIELAENFLAALAREARLPGKPLHPASKALLRGHRWPGNVRELQHVIERAFILAENRVAITPDLLLLPPQPARR